MVAVPYCGKLLASLGADVIKVEPPKVGDASRRRGPFPGDVPHPERSGTFLYLNTGKRSVTLDLDDPKGQDMLSQLAREVHVIIHDSSPAVAGARGLDRETLAEAINPSLIVSRRLLPLVPRVRIPTMRRTTSTSSTRAGKATCCPTGWLWTRFPTGPPSPPGE